MQTAVTPDCLVSALISLPVPGAPNFQRLESEETSPCLPGTRKQLVSTREGQAGRKASRITTEHMHLFSSLLPLLQGCFFLCVHCCSCSGTEHQATWASPTHGLSLLSSDVLFRKRFHTSGSAVIFFVGQARLSFTQIYRVWLCWQLVRMCWLVALGGLGRAADGTAE